MISNKPEKFKQEIIREVRAEMFSGPLPHPDILKKFNDIEPGFADRIMRQAEKQTDHRIEIENKVIHADIINSRIGLVFGFIISITGISGGVYLASLGFNVFGPILSGGTLVSMVSAFIYGTASRKSEREKRREQTSQKT